MQSYKSDLILSFNQGGQILFSYPLRGSMIMITCSNPSVLATKRGCTAIAIDNPAFPLDCQIVSSQLIITNPSFTNTLSVSGLIQVVVGIINPNTPITWNIYSYEYYYSATNYGQQGFGTTTYTPNDVGNTQQKRTQLRMLPFNTKVYSSTQSAFRMVFKLSSNPSLPTSIDYLLGYRLVLQQFTASFSFTTF